MLNPQNMKRVTKKDVKEMTSNTCFDCKKQGCSLWGMRYGKIDCNWFEKK